MSETIDTPYHFVPLGNTVHLPEWGPLVTQDRPFRDGLSGEIAYTLISDSPILIGGEKRNHDKNEAVGEVWPFRLAADGPYAIPGSTLKGMLRAVLEIAGLGRMRMVDDRRLGVRDLTGAREFYGDRMTTGNRHTGFKPRPRAGWLTLDPQSGGRKITPCEYARVEHDDLARYSNDPEWKSFPHKPAAAEKYRRWKESGKGLDVHFDPAPEQPHDHSQGKKLVYRKADLASGDTPGTLVFTGQPNKRDPGKPGCKHMEFVFFNEQEDRTFEVPDSVWRDFLHIHDKGKRKTDQDKSDWQYWQGEKRIPVFYLEKNGVLRSFGLALMYRLAYDFSVGDMIDHSSRKHRELPGQQSGYDLADLLFGAVGERPEDALRGRVSCEPAVAQGSPQPQACNNTVLSAPKPSFYPAYVEQPTADAKGKLKQQGSRENSAYASYSATRETPKPRIRGHKRYPARPPEDVAVQAPAPEIRKNKNIQVRLHPLPPGTAFHGRLQLHNLRPVELGALLWVLTWGGETGLRHSVGMGKPFGFGQIHFRIESDHSHLRPNDPSASHATLDSDAIRDLIGAFEQHMEAAAPGWAHSARLQTLRAMANPAAATDYARRTGAKLQYMELMRFQQGKKNGQALPSYVELSAAGAGPGSQGGASAVAFGHPWLDRRIPELMEEHRIRDPEQVVRGKTLATAWEAIESAEERTDILAAIEKLWKARNLFDEKPTGARKKAMAIYGWA
ncbi:TIGR03986 family CRISPR-associated RAMP protein [Thioalkalivibrio sp. AKL10]|uniref:TIGR03986 family type III CRISPR-associated RAMP protein n=1 Tax=Thioalkalivibrio sp. AKL10 TaxID=1158158 RepID=UPI0003783B63|nr:TIGR03986 family CRISPR-associated RAMP protein [Thioalkalivibrio sp. AKL10]